MYFKHERSKEKNILLKQIIDAVVLLNSCFFIRENEDTNYRKMGNFRVVQFSWNFAVGRDPRKLKSAKYIPSLSQVSQTTV